MSCSVLANGQVSIFLSLSFFVQTPLPLLPLPCNMNMKYRLCLLFMAQAAINFHWALRACNRHRRGGIPPLDFLLDFFQTFSSFKHTGKCSLFLFQLLGARTRAWRRALRLPGEEGPPHAQGGQEVLQADHLGARLLPQPFNLVRERERERERERKMFYPCNSLFFGGVLGVKTKRCGRVVVESNPASPFFPGWP